MSTLAALYAHSWPGNVRELKNYVQRVYILADGVVVGSAFYFIGNSGWAAFTEDVVSEWVRDSRGISRQELLATLSASLPGILAPFRQA